MKFLLDTNALIELNRRNPDSGLARWFLSVADGDLCHSVLVMGELRRGVLAAMSEPARERVETFIALLLAKNERVLFDIDLAIADQWAAVAQRHQVLRLQISAIDELIAATAIVHDLTVVTRNLRHFEHSGCKLLSPWTG